MTIPKSVHKDRLASNSDLFDFELSKDEINYLDSFDKGNE
ncbi:hypothetical protein Q2T40_02110 [Winogradskyella maritima]|nr:hypothetical protein [Winogradskyella maritima]